MIKVSVVGAKGRMGSHVVEAVNNAEDTQLALALDAGDDLTQITTDNTDVVVEFTVPSVSLGNVLALIAQGVDIVVGTTGRGLAIQAVDVSRPSNSYGVAVRAHIQNIGDQNISVSKGIGGFTVGTTGRGLQMELFSLSNL